MSDQPETTQRRISSFSQKAANATPPKAYLLRSNNTVYAEIGTLPALITNPTEVITRGEEFAKQTLTLLSTNGKAPHTFDVIAISTSLLFDLDVAIEIKGLAPLILQALCAPGAYVSPNRNPLV
jgi:hypothetical protein